MTSTLLFLVDDMADVPSFEANNPDCDITIAPNTEHAIQSLQDRNFEAVIADHKFQSNNDIPFLSRACNSSPNTNRILLCAAGAADLIETDPTIHLYLDKPCNAETVLAAVKKARVVATWLKNSEVFCLLSRMKNLPAVPSIYYRLAKVLQSTEVDRRAVGDLLAEDPAICEKVIQVVNSGSVGPDRCADNPYEVVSLLGTERTKALTLFAYTFSHFNLPADHPLSAEKLWDHSMATASLARMITREETGGNTAADSAFAGGLLHDLGKLMLGANFPEEYREVLTKAASEKIPLHDAETQILGANHAQIGACILGSWGLPHEIVESIGFHHSPSASAVEEFSPITGVHLANVLEPELSNKDDTLPHPLDPDHLEKVGFASRLPVWREILGCNVSKHAA